MGYNLKQGINDLQTLRPDLALEWHPWKNGDLMPDDVCALSGRSVWWQITVERFGKIFVLEWKAIVSNRTNGSGCPYTSLPPRKLLRGFNDLESTNPKLARKWHFEKNGNIRPDMIFENTDKCFWWYHKIFKNGKEWVHEWQAAPKTVKRSGDAGGCPICHGMQVLPGYNDLFTCFPEVAAEWNDDRNAPLSPKQVTPRSNKKVCWTCQYCGHTWKAMIMNRTAHNTGCPECAKRRQTSFPEQAIYFYLKRYFVNCVNRDKTCLEKGELDIYLPDEKLAIEYCGLFSHGSGEKKTADAQKQQRCMKKGITLIRICEHPYENKHFLDQHLIHCVSKEDNTHMNYVMDCLNVELQNLGIIGTPIFFDLKADEIRIREQYQKAQIQNSISVTHPHLLAEWDNEANGLLKPSGYSAGSGVRMYWKHIAEKNNHQYIHKWKAKISNRANGEGCPICSGKIVQIGYNDLYSCNPSFLPEWDDEYNDFSPREVTAHSKKKVWWKHTIIINRKEMLHRWQAAIDSRMRGNGCPICDGKIIQTGFNDLMTTHPELLAEWDNERNELLPGQISYGYDKKVWWKHTIVRNGIHFEHSWEASPNSRTNMRSGCPYCKNKKVLKGYNDLQTLLPEIAEKWDAEKNGELTPQDVTIASNKRVWWIDRDRPVKVVDRTKYARKNRGSD